jgi:Zn-finger nucleic acid-binding protein
VCDYCGSVLTAVACPSCYATMFAGSRFCPRCGAEAAREVLGDEALPCPRCRSEMQAVRVGGLVLRECSGCAGVWMDGEAFERLCGDREEHASVRSYVFSLTRPDEGRQPEVVRYVPCPSCKRIMNRVNFARRSGIILDVCKAHGVWLDHGELGRLVAFIDAGGLAVARERDREQARLAEEERRARETQPSPVQPTAPEYARSVFERRAFENLAALRRINRGGRVASDALDLLANVILGFARFLFLLVFGR